MITICGKVMCIYDPVTSQATVAFPTNIVEIVVWLNPWKATTLSKWIPGLYKVNWESTASLQSLPRVQKQNGTTTGGKRTEVEHPKRQATYARTLDSHLQATASWASFRGKKSLNTFYSTQLISQEMTAPNRGGILFDSQNKCPFHKKTHFPAPLTKKTSHQGLNETRIKAASAYMVPGEDCDLFHFYQHEYNLCRWRWGHHVTFRDDCQFWSHLTECCNGGSSRPHTIHIPPQFTSMNCHLQFPTHQAPPAYMS